MTPKMQKRLWRTIFYVLVAIMIFYTVFPFYWAIVSSLKSGSALFQVDFVPPDPAWDNYVAVFQGAPFEQNILNSVIVSFFTVVISLFLAVTASYALGRIYFRGRSTILLVVLGVSMFPQVAVLSGLFELIRALNLYNNLAGLVLSYLIMTLPFTVWVLTTFMRELPKELEEAAIVDGASPWQTITQVFMPLMGAGARHHRPAGLHPGVERVPVCPDLHPERHHPDGAGRDRADHRRQPVRVALGQHHGGFGDRHGSADRPGADLPAQDRLRPDRRRGEGLIRRDLREKPENKIGRGRSGPDIRRHGGPPQPGE